MNSSDRTAADLLRSALAADPARPLVTFYDDATGERVELSVATFANWVAKTANLLQSDLAAEPGDRLALLLPAHWQ
ncbi:TIGR03089 family protein, partial [Streptomyces sp. MBT57]|nr:TIGR03089 family protein [Streptomyces sp. MBT57]